MIQRFVSNAGRARSACAGLRSRLAPSRRFTEAWEGSTARSVGQHQQRPDARSFSRFAAVDHADAYERALKGQHGQQLSIAKLEGIGKDDAPFDPFIEEELREQAIERGEIMDEDAVDGGDNDSDTSDIPEATIVGKDDYEEDEDGDVYVYGDEEDEDEDESDDALVYNKDGSVIRNKSTLAALRAGYPAGGMLAVVEVGGSQHKVTTDDVLIVNRLKPVEHYKVGSVHTLKDVLLVGSSHLTLVGLPHVEGAEVDILIEEITQDAKVVVFKKRRRKHSQRKNGFRRDVTMARILDIRMPEEYADHEHLSRDNLSDIGELDDFKKPIMA
uniref:Large ribosomal subunit protein bL21m n=1 Tax=Craspedostauros australis TaxID=1486917 RepID=A0A7R9WY24_9STRA|mmetsp:Transcript_4314/g.11272  ORF Transcript_4314/g.11272 Transcript_4314/m.11272 type:complete len:329 (+) Transcript_4314:282-1268(+)|eukprot:CAMPEP_0198122776 /NCGR_PEP_ID=MMETSP1442-20131203/35788_1 /TAXON_ID= /ORGANISM="Craspedostauros australis, Strain CCMP3328" /LENGTH=328 /DNA_ID=CAMNT_0043781859 /DNA_START=186 /DNA_END=1175 /DNA_ORIENTATION=+